jgi:hypothetical protein
MAHRSLLFTVAVVLLVGLLESCAARGAGPQAWIDTPLDNTILPLAPMTVIAHASAEGGVAGIEFTIDDQPYLSVAADGGRLVWSEVEWTPPGAGTYLVGARGLGTDGVAGATVTARVTISEDASLPVPIPGPESLPIPLPQPESLPIPLPAPVPPSVVAKTNANCREGPGTAYDVYGSLAAGQEADLKGRLADDSWWLVLLTGRSMNCWLSASVVEVQGDVGEVQVVAANQLPQVPAGQPPTVDILPPASVQVDTTPPSFYIADVQPRVILKAGPGCPSHARTVTVATAIGDDGGLGSVIAYWSIGGSESGQVTLALGELGYWATVGPVNNTGSMQIYIIATDTAGNSAQSQTFVITVNECIG